jgi:hypothetical protein
MTMAPEISEKPERAADDEIRSSRPSTHGDSTASTVLPPSSAKGEKTAVQPGTDLSKLDSKVVNAQKEMDNDPFRHLPENEASILRKRKSRLESSHSIRSNSCPFRVQPESAVANPRDFLDDHLEG